MGTQWNITQVYISDYNKPGRNNFKKVHTGPTFATADS
jgi:hypothetical protein